MEILTFLIVGLFTGWLASVLVKGQGSGIFSDLAIGTIGAFVGGFIFSFFDITAYSFFGALTMSILGAVVFLLLMRTIYSKQYRNRINH